MSWLYFSFTGPPFPFKELGPITPNIYSIGVTLYFALSGKLPYDVGSSSQFDIFNKIVHESLPTVLSNRFLNETIQKSCQKNRENRFQSCIEFREDLKKNGFWAGALKTYQLGFITNT